MIDKTAMINKKAEIGENVNIGPYVMIGPNVKIHSNVTIESFASINGYTEISEKCHIFQSAVIGGIPQDLKYKGEKCYCKIGKRSIIREFVTINAGSEKGNKTEVGDDCLLMAYAHLGHNAKIGNSVIIANAGTLAGHVEIQDNVILGGLVGIHQFVKIGKMVIIGGCSKIVKDIPPFMLADGNPASVHSINLIGLQRQGYSKETIQNIKDAFKILYKSKLNFSNATEKLKTIFGNKNKDINLIIDFIEKSERGITRGAR